MRELSIKLSAITKTDGPGKIDEARAIISRLRRINLRWNIASLNEFLRQRQRELFLS